MTNLPAPMCKVVAPSAPMGGVEATMGGVEAGGRSGVPAAGLYMRRSGPDHLVMGHGFDGMHCLPAPLQLKAGDVHALLGAAASLTLHPAEEVMLAGFSLLTHLVGHSLDRERRMSA